MCSRRARRGLLLSYPNGRRGSCAGEQAIQIVGRGDLDGMKCAACRPVDLADIAALLSYSDQLLFGYACRNATVIRAL